MAVDLGALQAALELKFRTRFGEAVEEIYQAHGELNIRLHRDALRGAILYLRDESDFRFNMLSYMTAVDYSAMKRTPRFECVYMLYSLEKKHRVRIKCGLPEEDPVIDSLEPVFKTADWLERECFDQFGVIFRGHPDLRRILLPEDWVGHPLRKDFPLGGVKSFYFKRDTSPRAGEPSDLVPRIREQLSDI